MNRNELLYHLDNAIAYRGRLSQNHKDKWFNDPKARDYIMPMTPFLDRAPSALDQLEGLVKAIHEHEHERGALEECFNQALADAEYLAGRSAGQEIYRMVREIGDEQRQKANRPPKLQYIKDEDAYHLATCDLLLRAGAGFFKLEAINEKTKEKITHKIVLRRQHFRGLGREEIPVREALAKLLPWSDRKIFEYIREAKKLAVVDIKDQAFIQKLRKFFFESCEKDGITEFVFVQKEVPPTPQGILTYLLKNIIKPQPKVFHFIRCRVAKEFLPGSLRRLW